MIEYKKIPYFKLIPVILISVILFKLVDNIGSVTFFLKKLLSLMSYFIWGFAIAYVLNPLMVYLEKKTPLKRPWSIAVIYSIFIGTTSLIIILLTPRIIRNLMDLFNNMPRVITSSEHWLDQYILNSDFLNTYGFQNYLENNISSIMEYASSFFNLALNVLITNLINLSSLLLKFISGVVISIYLLNDKEHFIHNIKRFTYAVFSAHWAEHVIGFGSKLNVIFKKFVVGKLIDSIIVGTLCFIIMYIINIPNASVISIIIGITNMIPYFGNIIGMIPACLITFFYSPSKALQAAAVILFLQQLDGWFISPKILGDKIGLSPLWVILGIALGGGLFGITGMFLGVPAAAVIKTAIEEFTDKKLKSKNISEIP